MIASVQAIGADKTTRGILLSPDPDPVPDPVPEPASGDPEGFTEP